MNKKKNLFLRAFDAMIEARSRLAHRIVADHMKNLGDRPPRQG